MQWNTHLEANGLKKDKEVGDGVTQIVVEARPAFDHLVFFARLDEQGLACAKETGKLELFSVPTAAMAAQMVVRGYTRVFCNNLNDDTHLPPRISSSSSAGAGPSRPSLLRTLMCILWTSMNDVRSRYGPSTIVTSMSPSMT